MFQGRVYVGCLTPAWAPNVIGCGLDLPETHLQLSLSVCLASRTSCCDVTSRVGTLYFPLWSLPAEVRGEDAHAWVSCHETTAGLHHWMGRLKHDCCVLIQLKDAPRRQRNDCIGEIKKCRIVSLWDNRGPHSCLPVTKWTKVDAGLFDCRG